MKYNISALAVALLCVSCGNRDGETPDVVADSFDFAGKQLNYAFTQIDSTYAQLSDSIRKTGVFTPHTKRVDGSLSLVDPSHWCSGFFPGELWYMYEYTGDEAWKKKAEEFTAPMEVEKTDNSMHDLGFMMYCSFGNGYRLTNDSIYRDILLESAATLSTRYSDKTKCIRSWDHSKDKWQYPVIIDNMMNLELLYWAFKESGDSTFYNIATTHALTTLKNHFHPDGHSYHVVDYDTVTGNPRLKQTHQGYSDDSAWSRGQAWGLYGTTMCYRETKRPEFLDQAKLIAKYIFTNPNMPEDLIPYWDYMAPNIPDESRDASAAAVSACALYELSMYDKENGEQYKAWADTIVKNLSDNYRAKLGGDCGFLLLHSTGSGHGEGFEIDYPLVYADYYFLEALLKKAKLENEGTAIL